MSRTATVGAVLTTASGTLLLVALLLSWWGPPADLVDPPADLPDGLALLAEGFERGHDFSEDGFGFFDFRDALWLATGIAAFALGLAALARLPRIAILAAVTALVSTASLAFLIATLVSPPDYLDIGAEMFGRDPFPGLDYDLPFTREAGGFVALAATAGAVTGSLVTLRAGQR